MVDLPWTLRQLRKLPLPRKLGALERLYGRSLARLGIGVVETACGVHWKLDLRNPTHRWIVYGDYEGEFIPWARKWLEEKPGIVIDSGANIGQTLIYFAPVSGTKVFAFEPIPACQIWLKSCLEGYPEWDCEVVGCGLSNDSGSVEILQAGLGENCAEWSTMNTGWFEGRGFKKLEVPVIRLDEFLETRGVDRVRLWKLDVEGWELKALEGAQTCLKKRLLDAIYAEVSDQTRQTALTILGSAGYQGWRIRGRSLVPLQETATGTASVLFLSENGRVS